MVKFNGINHLAMATRDMDRTIRFWRGLLGMRLVAGLGSPEYRPTPASERTIYTSAGRELFHEKKGN